jgi:hypothetical protein
MWESGVIRRILAIVSGCSSRDVCHEANGAIAFSSIFQHGWARSHFTHNTTGRVDPRNGFFLVFGVFDVASGFDSGIYAVYLRYLTFCVVSLPLAKIYAASFDAAYAS